MGRGSGFKFQRSEPAMMDTTPSAARPVGLLLLLILLTLASPALAQEGHTILPGGMKALGFAAQMRPNIPPDLFALEYCQALQSNAQSNDSKDDVNKLHRYFQSMDTLRKLMTPSSTGLDTTLDVSTLSGFYKTRDIF